MITTEPLSQNVDAGTHVTFVVTATGNAKLKYQWYLNGVAISRKKKASLEINHAKAADDGTYTVTVTNGIGSATSDPATLTVDVAPAITTQPISQTVDEGAVATFTVMATGTPAPTYQWYLGGVAVSGATSATLTLNDVLATDAGSYTVTATNSVSSATSKDATLTVDTPPVITTQPLSQTVVSGTDVTFTVGATGIPAPTYLWSLNGTPVSGGTKATLTINNAKLADAGTYTVTVMNSDGFVTSAGAVLAVDVAPVITTQPVSQTADEGSNVTFTVVATGTPAPTYQWYLGGLAVSGATSATLSLTNVQPANAGSYTVTVSNSVSSVTSKAATLTVDAAPAITTEPVSQTVVAGTDVTFTVAATGNPAPTYQWSFNGAAITGATKATLTINNTKAAAAGTYIVIVANTVGSATSSPATLTVLVPPAITTQPASQTVTAGSNVTFTAVATGTPVLTYQWTFDGTPISGATASSLNLTNVQAAAEGDYSVTVTNSAGDVMSKNAVLNVK